MSRTPFIAGNWKMHKTLAPARALVSGIVDGLSADLQVDVLICPPVQLLFPMAKAVANTPVKLGAQHVHEANEGAFTGEVSASMLADTGCQYVIVGHSERRHVFGESGDRLAKKLVAVTEAGMTAVYCVGETIEQREAGQTEAIVEAQLRDAITAETPTDRLIVAYEPVWAIGTGKTATPDQAQEVHAFIRAKLSDCLGGSSAQQIRIIYGGSVKPGNAVELLAQPDLDGALVGGACLVADDFLAIIASS